VSGAGGSPAEATEPCCGEELVAIVGGLLGMGGKGASPSLQLRDPTTFANVLVEASGPAVLGAYARWAMSFSTHRPPNS